MVENRPAPGLYEDRDDRQCLPARFAEQAGS